MKLSRATEGILGTFIFFMALVFGKLSAMKVISINEIFALLILFIMSTIGLFFIGRYLRTIFKK